MFWHSAHFKADCHSPPFESKINENVGDDQQWKGISEQLSIYEPMSRAWNILLMRTRQTEEKDIFLPLSLWQTMVFFCRLTIILHPPNQFTLNI